MKNLKALIILFIIIVLISYAYYISDCVVEKFLFLDNQKSTLSINQNILKHSILLSDDKINQKYTDSIITSIGTSCEKMLKNLILHNNEDFSEWIRDIEERNTVINNVCNYVVQYVKKKYDVIFFKLNKYKYSKNMTSVILDIDFVFHKGLHAKIVCMLDIPTRNIKFYNIKAVGTISEDKIWQVEEVDEPEEIVGKDNNYLDANLNELMYSDTCLSMKTQDQQLHNLLYAKLMYIPDKASIDNLQYMENQNKVRRMFMDKLSNPRQKMMNNCYKNYPYKNDFEIV